MFHLVVPTKARRVARRASLSANGRWIVETRSLGCAALRPASLGTTE
jgi:hypothetical protein